MSAGRAAEAGKVVVARTCLADVHGVSEIAELTLHNPGKRNAITVAMWRPPCRPSKIARTR
jgi:enoyl-CoA hydratase/carnithine racemase